MTDQETVIKALENCTDKPKCKDCPWVECEHEHETVEIPMDLAKDALELLKVQGPRVMTLEEVEHLTYGSPYIIETNLQKEEPRLMYGLFSHLGLQGNFSFAFTDGRGYLFDVDYGKRWRCWTSAPTDEQREATPWEG